MRSHVASLLFVLALVGSAAAFAGSTVNAGGASAPASAPSGGGGSGSVPSGGGGGSAPSGGGGGHVSGSGAGARASGVAGAHSWATGTAGSGSAHAVFEHGLGAHGAAKAIAARAQAQQAQAVKSQPDHKPPCRDIEQCIRALSVARSQYVEHLLVRAPYCAHALGDFQALTDFEVVGESGWPPCSGAVKVRVDVPVREVPAH
jgi:hypothetical protein